MRISNQAINDLKNILLSLDPDYVKNLQERIKENRGLDFSTQYINWVLNPENKRYNKIIIDEAILYAKECKVVKEDIENEINNLKNGEERS